MAVLRVVCAFFLLLMMSTSSHAHHMGRTIPIVHSPGQAALLAGNIVAAYFEEQMGRNMELSPKSSVAGCVAAVMARESPMAIGPVMSKEEIPDGLVVVLPGLDTGQGVFTLAMGREAKKDLQFSLVPRYMEKLSEKLSVETWAKGLERVKAGEGVRKVALDMLRENDL